MNLEAAFRPFTAHFAPVAYDFNSLHIIF